MRVALVFAVSALLLAGCREIGSSPPPEYHPEEAGTVDHALCLLGFTAVPVIEVATGHHLIEATINGRTGEFVLDTGANMSVIDNSHVAEFGVSPGSGGLGGAIGVGGGGRASRTLIDSFTIGSIAVRQRRIVTADLGQLLRSLSRMSGTTVYGIIGQDVLTEHRAIIDVSRPMLYLMAADRDPAPVPAERCQAAQPGEEKAAAGRIATGPSDELRTLHFGSSDRMRRYGADLRDRIKAVESTLSRFTATPEESIRHGLIRGESVFIATKV